MHKPTAVTIEINRKEYYTKQAMQGSLVGWCGGHELFPVACDDSTALLIRWCGGHLSFPVACDDSHTLKMVIDLAQES